MNTLNWQLDHFTHKDNVLWDTELMWIALKFRKYLLITLNSTGKENNQFCMGRKGGLGWGEEWVGGGAG